VCESLRSARGARRTTVGQSATPFNGTAWRSRTPRSRRRFACARDAAPRLARRARRAEDHIASRRRRANECTTKVACDACIERWPRLVRSATIVCFHSGIAWVRFAQISRASIDEDDARSVDGELTQHSLLTMLEFFAQGMRDLFS